MISSYQSSRETFLCLVIINQLANPLRTQLSPKLPLTVEICRDHPFMRIDVMNCVVVVYAIHFRLRIWLVDNGDATKMAAVMIQAKPTFYPVHSQNSSSISADQFGKNLLTEIFCVANHTTKNCSLIDCSYDILLIEKWCGTIVWQVEWGSVHVWVCGLFITCSNSDSLRESVCAKKGIVSIWGSELEVLTNTSKRRHKEIQVLLKREFWGNNSRNTSISL